MIDPINCHECDQPCKNQEAIDKMVILYYGDWERSRNDNPFDLVGRRKIKLKAIESIIRLHRKDGICLRQTLRWIAEITNCWEE